MLTLEDFTKIPDDQVFANGDIENSPEGVYMTNNRIGDMLSWVAKKGMAQDWAIYIHWKESGLAFVKTNGDKVHDKINIQKLIPCEQEVLTKYRF